MTLYIDDAAGIELIEEALDGGAECGSSKGVTSSSEDVVLVCPAAAPSTPFTFLVLFLPEPSERSERIVKHAQSAQTTNPPMIARPDQA